MSHTELGWHQTTWHDDGYTAGLKRGIDDGHAELDGTYRRQPDHNGTPDEPPAHLNGDHADMWTCGFLDGYADGRNETLRGAA